MKVFYIIMLSTIFFSCSDNFEQSYENFTKFNQATLRLKSWFPAFIAADCYDLKEIHGLDNNNSFGRFSYKNNFRIESLLSDSTVYEKVTFATLHNFLKKIIKPVRPDWFIDDDEIQVKTVYRKGYMYLIKSEIDKIIYFTYSKNY